MLWNYIKVGLRNLFRHKVFSFINIFGLSISMSVCLLIISMIAGLSKYDRFHENYDRIYRVLSKRENSGNFNATTPMPIREALIEDYSGIEKIVTFKRGFGGDASYENTSVPLVGYFCSEELFDVFSFKLEKGNPSSALKDPFSVVLTQESAKKVFGDKDPLGKVIRFSERGLVMAGIPNKNKPTFLGDFTVTGVLDEIPGKTHLEFHILASMSTLPTLETQGIDKTLQADWKNNKDAYSYLLLDKERDQTYLQSVLDNIANHEQANYEDYSIVFAAQPMSKITPGKLYGNPFSFRLPLQAIYFLSILAALVIVSACFNYTNLSLAKSLSRAKEVGIRKVAGAFKHQVLGQFIGESVILSLLSLILAIGILEMLKPAFRGLWLTKYIKVDMAGDIPVYLVFFIFSVLIGIIAGVLPAFYLSSFKPIKVLKGASGMKAFKKVNLRKILIVAQFSMALFFIISTTLIYFQLNHLMNAEYGFNKENIVNVPLHGNAFENYANNIKNHSGITRVSGSSIVMATGGTSHTFLKRPENPDDSLGTSQMSADRSYIESIELEILAGTNFQEHQSGASENHILVNEQVVEKLGYANALEIVGESFLVNKQDQPVIVIGVVRDFHYSHMIDQIGPFIIRNLPERFRYANIKVSAGDLDNTMVYLDEKWKEIDNDHAFEPQFMNDQLAESHAIFGDITYIVGFIAIVAISIACLGLLGMVLYVTNTKIKEIGIRKVHGARLKDVVFMLSKGFLIMLLIAIIIATPLAKLANELWLREFAVRVQFGYEILGIGILILFVLGLITIFSQTIKTARTNPIDALRYE